MPELFTSNLYCLNNISYLCPDRWKGSFDFTSTPLSINAQDKLLELFIC